MDTITTKRREPVAPSAGAGMDSQADRLDYHALRAREEPAAGPFGVPRFLAIVSSSDFRPMKSSHPLAPYNNGYRIGGLQLVASPEFHSLSAPEALLHEGPDREAAPTLETRSVHAT
jgi:hypothetical protein